MGDSKVDLITTGLQNNMILVEYPGLVKNDENMLKTLGGINNISRTFSNEKRRLELRYHPDNVYNKPLYGDSTKTSGLFVKVKIKRPKDPNNKEAMTHTVEVLGKCTKKYSFNSLCDFQYLPLQKDSETNKVSLIYDEITPQDKDEDFFAKADAPLFCCPYIFAKTDSVNPKIHRTDKDQKQNVGNDDFIGLARSKVEGAEFVSFNLTDSFPDKPNPSVAKRLQIKYVSNEQFERVRQLFNEVPVWNRIALAYESGVSNDKMKVILPSVAYYFMTGPWRVMYVRYGYDPRKDFQSRFYQTFDFRYRFKTGVGSLVKARNEAKNEPIKDELSVSNDSGAKPKQNIFYPYFEEGQLPRSRQCIYRYCDIRIPKIQEMLKRVPSPASGIICNEKSGWLPPNFNDECRQIIADQIKEYIRALKQKSRLESPNESFNNSDDDFEEDNNEEESEYGENLEQMSIDEDLNNILIDK